MQFYNQTQAGTVSTGGENDEEVPVYAELTHVAGDLVTGELPILSQARALATLASGVDPYSGEQVGGWDRALRILDVLPGGRKLRQGGGAAAAGLGAFGILRRHGDEAADAASVAAKRGAFAAPKAVAANYPEGTFSITAEGFRGYPGGLPRPDGPFRLLDGDELSQARAAANRVNNDIRRNNGLSGLPVDIHEIQPVKFGGSPTDQANKTLLERNFHRQKVTPWWNQLQREIEGGGG
jgi:hypothetical protein